MDFSGAAAHSILAQISGGLAGTAPDVQSILTTLTRSLSRIRSGTWFAVLLDPDPSTSHVVVAGDSDGSMSAYVDGFVKTLAGPTGTPTLTLSQQVVETSDPVLIPSVPFTDFISLLSPAGQSYFSSHPPPHALDAVGVLVVPMRAGGAIIGTLGIFDWQQQPALSEDDVVRVQLIGDHGRPGPAAHAAGCRRTGHRQAQRRCRRRSPHDRAGQRALRRGQRGVSHLLDTELPAAGRRVADRSRRLAAARRVHQGSGPDGFESTALPFCEGGISDLRGLAAPRPQQARRRAGDPQPLSRWLGPGVAGLPRHPGRYCGRGDRLRGRLG